MHTFIALPAATPNGSLTRFGGLNPEFEQFSLDEFDLAELRLGAGLAGSRVFLGLPRLSLLPGRALKLLGCTNARELMLASQYRCGMLGGDLRYSFVPVGVVTSVDGLEKYGKALGHCGPAGETAVQVLADIERFDIGLLEAHDLTYEVWLTRFERIYLGCGHTWEMLCTLSGAPASAVEPVGVALSNGDTLVGFAYAVKR